MKNKLSLLPILAAIVGIAASAFTVKTGNHTSNANVDTYYWFDVASVSGTVITPASSPEFSGNLQSKPYAIGNNIQGCNDTAIPPCVGGYTASQVNLNGSGQAISVKSSGGVYQQPVAIVTKTS